MLCIFRAQNQCLLLSKHRFTSWVARQKRAPPFFFTYAFEWIPCRHVLMCLLYFLYLGDAKGGSTWTHKKKTLYHNVCKHSSCQFFLFFSFTVHSFSLVFSWWASFLLSLSCVVLDGRTVTQKRLWRFFLHKWRRQAIIIFLVELRVSVVLK